MGARFDLAWQELRSGNLRPPPQTQEKMAQKLAAASAAAIGRDEL